MTQYKKMVIRNQFKKTYSTISNAFNKSIQDMGGGNIECTNADNEGTSSHIADCKALWLTYFLDNLQVSKFCENKAYENGCVPDYKAEDFPSTAGCGGFAYNQIKEKNPAAVLNDGTIVFPYAWNGNTYYATIGFDVNGFKGPNKGGQDVFSLGIANKGGIPTLGAWRDGNISYCLPISEPLFGSYYIKDILNK